MSEKLYDPINSKDNVKKYKLKAQYDKKKEIASFYETLIKFNRKINYVLEVNENHFIEQSETEMAIYYVHYKNNAITRISVYTKKD